MQQIHDFKSGVAEAFRRTVGASAKSYVSRIYFCGDRRSRRVVFSAEAGSKADKDSWFVPLAEEEILFLKKISGNTEQEIQRLRGDGREESENREKDCFLVRPSEIAVNQDGTIDVIRGPLKAFEKEILRINLHKRYAVVQVKMLGEKTVLFGIVMEKDGERRS